MQFRATNMYIELEFCGLDLLPHVMLDMPSSTVEKHENVISQAVRLVNQISVVRVDIVITKLARGNLALEHDVHLLEGTVLGLWQAEESPYGGEQR